MNIQLQEVEANNIALHITKWIKASDITKDVFAGCHVDDSCNGRFLLKLYFKSVIKTDGSGYFMVPYPHENIAKETKRGGRNQQKSVDRLITKAIERHSPKAKLVEIIYPERITEMVNGEEIKLGYKENFYKIVIEVRRDIHRFLPRVERLNEIEMETEELEEVEEIVLDNIPTE